jgi:serine/threonine protein kinase
MPGMTILHYEFLEKIGSGGMGEVFKALDNRLNRNVAIKLLPYGMSADPDRRRRFIQEAQTASALNHPNIITIHDIFHEGDTNFIVMEYVAGRTLLDSIPPGGMNIGQMLLCSAQMASALSAAHEAGIVHRDFKPANVMICDSGLVKILDFGLAKLLQPIWMTNSAGASGESATIQLAVQPTISGAPQTAEGSILGTVNYMAPEQAEGKKVDGRADIFALGAVMYEMLTSRRAFQGDSDIATLSAVLRDDPKPMSQLAQDVPPDLEDFIRVCLRKDPATRWQTMKEVELGLIALKRRADAGEFSGRQAAVAPAAQGTRRTAPSFLGTLLADRKKLAIAGGALAAVLLIASSAVWIVRGRSHASAPVAVSAPVSSSQPQAASPVPTTEPQPAPDVANPAQPAPAQQTSAVPAPPKKSAAPIPPPQPVATAASPTPATTAAPPVPAPVPEPPKPSKAETATTTAQSIPVNIGDAIAFKIALVDDVPNDADEGSELTFRAAEDVKVGDVLVIGRGATVKGAVVTGNGKRFLGMGGKMTFKLISAEAVDGQKIPVRASVARRADGPTTRPVDTGKYAKPKELAAARGTDYIAYIDGDRTINIRK